MDNPIFSNKQFSFNNEDLLQDVSEATRNILEMKTEISHYAAEDVIFSEGGTPEGIYHIKSGIVKKCTQTLFGSDHIFYVCKQGEYLGYHALLSEEQYHDSAQALTDCEIEFIPKEQFLKAVEESHLLSRRLLKKLSHEFVVFVNATKLLAKHTVRERTALNLIILEDKFKTASGKKTEISISRDNLASMVGTAKESVVRMLKDFKEEALITTKGRSIFIEDYQGLLKVINNGMSGHK